MEKKTAYLGIFLALAMILSYVESCIPFSIGIPGIKLGLANLVVIMLLYEMGAKEAFLVAVLRILLTGFLFGNGFSIIYSLAGGLLSFTAMILLKKTGWFACVTISIAGGVFHNIGQLLAAALVINNGAVFYYTPVLLLAGIVMGFINGIISQEVLFRIGERLPKGGKK